jgi:hypothetical protein
LIVGTGQREHNDLQKAVAQADAFSVFHLDLEYSGTAVFARDYPWQVKMELWIPGIFAIFSTAYDCPVLQI